MSTEGVLSTSPLSTTTEKSLQLEDFFTGTRLIAVIGGIAACTFVLLVLLAIAIVFCIYRPKVRKRTDGEIGLPGEFTEMHAMKSHKNGILSPKDRSKLATDSWSCSANEVPEDLSDVTPIDYDSTLGRKLRVTEIDPIYQETDHVMPSRNSTRLPVIEESVNRPYKPIRKSVSFKKNPRKKYKNGRAVVLKKEGEDNPAFEVHAEDEVGYDTVGNINFVDDGEDDNEPDHIYSDPGTYDVAGIGGKYQPTQNGNIASKTSDDDITTPVETETKVSSKSEQNGTRPAESEITKETIAMDNEHSNVSNI